MFNFSIFHKLKNKILEWTSTFSPNIRKVIWAFLFILIVSIILTYEFFPGNSLKVGQVSQKDIEAPRTETYIDKEETEERRKKAAESVEEVYEEAPEAVQNPVRDINNLFTSINVQKDVALQKNIEDQENKENQNNQQNQTINNLTEEQRNEIIASIKEEYGDGITEKSIKLLLETSPKKNENIKNKAVNIIQEKSKEKIYPKTLNKVKDELVNEVMAMDFTQEYRLALANIVENMVRPNMILDKEATEQKKEEAMDSVDPYTRTVKRGEILVRKGEVVTEENIKTLEALGLQKSRVDYLSVIGALIILITIIIILAIYFYKYKPDIWNHQKKIALIQVLIIIVLLLAKIIDVTINFTQLNYLYYLVPVAAASILTTVLISTNVAVIVTVFLSLLTALVFNMNYNVTLTAFIGGLVGVFSVSKMSQRNDLVLAGLNVSAVLITVIIGLRLTEPWNGWLDLLWFISMGILNGFIVSILANGLLPLMENLFNMTSSVKLLELSNPSHPLLKRLLVEAPGSYHHSVIVGNLAETAADNIGADSLTARVGSYYHDIGKMKRTYFFVENIYGNDNPHDKLSANLSALIIKSHVKDGVEMAKKHNLPEVIIDIIKQHHGTNLISYFYKEALEDSVHDSIEESDFRYDGPKPQSKEAAIIMLADIVEAAVRSKNFNKNNHNRIEGLVRELIKDKLFEGQLDESDLSLKDLDTIAESFVKVLSGIYHQRIDYPENIIKEMEKADKSD